MTEELLVVKGLKKWFIAQKNLRGQATAWLKAVDGIDFSIPEHGTFSLIGESGCGKTTTARLLLLLEKASNGSVLFSGQEIFSLKGDKLRNYRRSMQAVFQEPYSSLSPRMRIRDIVSEPLYGESYRSKCKRGERVAEVLDAVGLSRDSASLFPHEFSGGQRQRIAIARAIATEPKCIILDEPVSALDVSVRAQVMNLLRQLQDRFGLTYLLIAHDLAVVKYMSTWVGVMYLGKLVEVARCADIYSEQLHPYTQALLHSALPLRPDTSWKRIVLSGEVPSPLNPPSGCRFHPRCSVAKPICSEIEPELRVSTADHKVYCHLY